MYVRNRRRHLWWQWWSARRWAVSTWWRESTTRWSISSAASSGTGSRSWPAAEIVRINSAAETSTGCTWTFLCNSSRMEKNRRTPYEYIVYLSSIVQWRSHGAFFYWKTNISGFGFILFSAVSKNIISAPQSPFSRKRRKYATGVRTRYKNQKSLTA